MGLTVFQVLDRAVEAGGAALAGKDIAGSGKAATTVLGEMCSSGLLDKKGTKYSLTKQGQEAWEREAPEDRRQEVSDRRGQQRRKALAGFVTLIAGKAGKALTRAELVCFPAEVRQEACERKLAEAGTTANSFRLLPAGEEMVQAEQPFEVQLERLRRQHRESAAAWQAARQRLARDLDGAGGQALRAVAEQLAERGAAALRAFDAAVADLAGLAAVADAARLVRTEVEAMSRQAQQEVEAERGRLSGIEERLRQEAGRHREQLESLERRIAVKLEEAAHRQVAAPAPVAPAPAVPAPPVPETVRNRLPPADSVWPAARAAHERLRQESLRIGGIVKVPELTDTVLRSADGLTAAAFHDMLRGWQQEGRLTLQLCNDPRLEPRASEGIQSPRGLLFYVHMR